MFIDNLSFQSALFTDKHSIEFLIRLAINLVSCLVLIRFIYYPIYRNREYFFTFIIFNLLIFLITILLNKVEMSMGAAFGLFAVFSMLRYRTEGLSMKDMTYLFLVIAMGLVTAVGAGQWWEIALLNTIIIGITYLLESNLLMKKEHSKIIQYENIELIKPGRQDELKMDLESRTGLKINRIDINSIDFLKDTALITVHYHD
ncbi:MAG: hypothetical protein K0R65_189 [Crocinitomicaceae bacterium]|jgi:hypothetical protein|nr:hypothetical protein [Crocinitomicaceae bacterium]